MLHDEDTVWHGTVFRRWVRALRYATNTMSRDDARYLMAGAEAKAGYVSAVMSDDRRVLTRVSWRGSYRMPASARRRDHEQRSYFLPSALP
jgi:hypothetical protein